MHILSDLLLNLVGCLIYNYLSSLLFRNVVLMFYYYNQPLIIITFRRILIVAVYMMKI